MILAMVLGFAVALLLSAWLVRQRPRQIPYVAETLVVVGVILIVAPLAVAGFYVYPVSDIAKPKKATDWWSRMSEQGVSEVVGRSDTRGEVRFAVDDVVADGTGLSLRYSVSGLRSGTAPELKDVRVTLAGVTRPAYVTTEGMLDAGTGVIESNLVAKKPTEVKVSVGSIKETLAPVEGTSAPAQTAESTETVESAESAEATGSAGSTGSTESTEDDTSLAGGSTRVIKGPWKLFFLVDSRPGFALTRRLAPRSETLETGLKVASPRVTVGPRRLLLEASVEDQFSFNGEVSGLAVAGILTGQELGKISLVNLPRLKELTDEEAPGRWVFAHPPLAGKVVVKITPARLPVLRDATAMSLGQLGRVTAGTPLKVKSEAGVVVITRAEPKGSAGGAAGSSASRGITVSFPADGSQEAPPIVALAGGSQVMAPSQVVASATRKGYFDAAFARPDQGASVLHLFSGAAEPVEFTLDLDEAQGNTTGRRPTAPGPTDIRKLLPDTQVIATYETIAKKSARGGVVAQVLKHPVTLVAIGRLNKWARVSQQSYGTMFTVEGEQPPGREPGATGTGGAKRVVVLTTKISYVVVTSSQASEYEMGRLGSDLSEVLTAPRR